MKIQQIRSATIIVTYADKRILIDPWLSEKGALPPIPETLNQNKRNPLVDLPISLDEIVRVDAAIVTHLHFDHFDDAAKEALPKDLPVFVQNENEAKQMQDFGFQNVTVLSETGIDFDGITLTKTKGLHGVGEEIEALYKKFNDTGEVCGVVMSHPEEKTFYIAGDTVWCNEVKTAIDKYHPDIIVLNAGDAQFLNGIPIIMGANDVWEVCKAAPQAKVIASHMEAINHAMLSRTALKAFVNEKGLTNQVLIPSDGESYSF